MRFKSVFPLMVDCWEKSKHEILTMSRQFYVQSSAREHFPLSVSEKRKSALLHHHVHIFDGTLYHTVHKRQVQEFQQIKENV